MNDLLADRITPRQVLQAYERTGFNPEREVWFHDNEKYGVPSESCALSAVTFDRLQMPKLTAAAFRSPSWIPPLIIETLGITGVYLDGFVEGFDSDLCMKDSDYYEMYEGWNSKGFFDGRRAAKFVNQKIGFVS